MPYIHIHEYLNSLDLSGIPLVKLNLKGGCPIIMFPKPYSKTRTLQRIKNGYHLLHKLCFGSLITFQARM